MVGFQMNNMKADGWDGQLDKVDIHRVHTHTHTHLVDSVFLPECCGRHKSLVPTIVQDSRVKEVEVRTGSGQG